MHRFNLSPERVRPIEEESGKCSASTSSRAEPNLTHQVGMQRLMNADEKPTIHLLEYDQRFSVYEDYIAYNYEFPFRLPRKILIASIETANIKTKH